MSSRPTIEGRVKKAMDAIVKDDTVTSPSTDTVTDTVAVTDTSTITGTGTLLEAKPVELMNRHVCYLTNAQSDFVRKMAKKHKVKESEIIRIAIKLLMKELR